MRHIDRWLRAAGDPASGAFGLECVEPTGPAAGDAIAHVDFASEARALLHRFCGTEPTQPVEQALANALHPVAAELDGYPARLLLEGLTDELEVWPWELHPDVSSGLWSLARYRPSPGVSAASQYGGATPRILFLIGDQRQDGTLASWGAVETMLAALEPLGSDVTVAIPSRFGADERLSPFTIEPFERIEEVEMIVRRGWHVVHYCGHHVCAGHTNGLTFDVGDAIPALVPVTSDDEQGFDGWLDGQRPSLVILQGCETHGVGAVLRARADHVMTWFGRVRTDEAAAFAAAFYRELPAQHWCLAPAMRATRRRLAGRSDSEAWMVGVWSSTTRDVLWDPPAASLAAYRRRLAAHLNAEAHRRTALFRLPLPASQEVYVPLQLVGRPNSKRNRPDSGFEQQSPEPLGPWTLSEVLGLTPAEGSLPAELGERRRWLVLATAGGGKSTSLRQVALAAAADPAAAGVPVFAVLPRLCAAVKTDEIGRDDLFAHAAGVRDEDSELAAGSLAHEAARDRVVFLFDGFDELNAADQSRVTGLIDDLPESCMIVVASRPTELAGGWFDGPEWTCAQIEPLSPDARRDLLRQILEREGVPELLGDLITSIETTGDERLREMAGNPSLLTMLAYHVAESRSVDAALASSRDQLISSVLDALLTGRTQGGRRRRSVWVNEATQALARHAGAIRTVLQRVAFESLERGRLDVDVECLRGHVEALVPLGPSEWATSDDFLEAFEQCLGMLYPADADPKRWVWWHRSICELLAAEGWWGQFGESAGRVGEFVGFLQTRVLDLRGESFSEARNLWEEPLSMIAARLGRASDGLPGVLPEAPLLDLLTYANVPDHTEEARAALGRRILLASERLEGALLDRLLETVPIGGVDAQGLNTKEELFRALPRFSLEPALPDVATRVLDWRKRTRFKIHRDSEDPVSLIELGMAVDLLARMGRDAEIATLMNRCVPPLDHPERFVQPLGTKGPWIRIPAREFRLGAGHGIEGEEVQISRDFWIMEAPITFEQFEVLSRNVPYHAVEYGQYPLQSNSDVVLHGGPDRTLDPVPLVCPAPLCWG